MKILKIFVLGLIISFSSLSYAEELDPETAPDLKDVKRVIAIGDVHGDYDSLIELLQHPDVNIIDKNLKWVGGNTVLISTGDILDRGNKSKQALDLFMRLEDEARLSGGETVVLLGNHEVMNLTGDLRYLGDRETTPYNMMISDAEYSKQIEKIHSFYHTPRPDLKDQIFQSRLLTWITQFLDPNVRQKLFQTLLYDSNPKISDIRGYVHEAGNKAISHHYSKGYVGHRHAMSPRGVYGAWLLSRPSIYKIDKNLFMHGGLSPSFGRTPFRRIREKGESDLRSYMAIRNKLISEGLFNPLLDRDDMTSVLENATGSGYKKDLSEISKIMDGPLFHSEGIAWYRGWAEPDESRSEGSEGSLNSVLKKQDAERMIIGHTPTSNKRIKDRYDGKVWLIDTGMNKAHYYGNAEALEIIDGVPKYIISIRGRRSAKPVPVAPVRTSPTRYAPKQTSSASSTSPSTGQSKNSRLPDYSFKGRPTRPAKKQYECTKENKKKDKKRYKIYCR